MKKQKQKRRIKTFNTDQLMIKMWHTLERDRMRCVGAQQHHPAAKYVSVDTIDAYRQYVYPDCFQSSGYMVKWEKQLECLFKRYIFKRDLYDPDELNLRTDELWHDVQKHVCLHMYHQEPLWVKNVVQTARRLIKEILGPYDEKVHMGLCSFGTKATTGSSARDAYLDSKITALTGSVGQHLWFQKYLDTDPLLQEILSKHGEGSVVTHLNQSNVPKSYKIFRGITPNTTIGNFHTIGLGRYLMMRLSQAKLNIRKLQDRHRKWVKWLSKTLTHVTADLSSASHCYTSALINRLVPRDWFVALNVGRIRYVDVGGVIANQASFMAMGIGFTFPLQTLCFYAILKAIATLTGTKGRISVYGDDLIYPRRMHTYAAKALVHLGFKLNTDKTFVTSKFRESCGADFFDGVDVRPFQPEGSAAELNGIRYNAFLYKTINGLLLRWDVNEVRETFRMLILEVLRVSSVVHSVPNDYPDYSGIKMHGLPGFSLEIPWAAVSRDFTAATVAFPCIAETTENRLIRVLDIYRWEKYRQMSLQTDEMPRSVKASGIPILFGVKNGRALLSRWLYDTVIELPRWVRDPDQPKRYRSKLTGRRLIRRVPVSALYGSTRYVRAAGVRYDTPEVGYITL